VKSVCVEIGFKNPFDVTKIDNISILPKTIREKDYALIHIGKGQHKFIKGIDKLYHTFEPIEEQHDWMYRKSLLNDYNTSESNVLSVANNQRMLHHFLFEVDTEFESLSIANRPKTYFPHRTKTDLEYYIASDKVYAKNVQIEIDLTIEYQGRIGIFEAKNGSPKTFSVYQLYHPFLYYHKARQKPELSDKITDIFCVYVVRKRNRNQESELRFWCYTFANPYDITSIILKKSACYRLYAS
jgi:hypothetical protein